MADPGPVPPPPAPRPAVRSAPRRWLRRILKWFFLSILVVVIIFAAYVYIALHWSYSHGERAGYVQKFSKKGWLSKTWEGELAMVSIPGTMPEKFYFTVWEDSIADKINQNMGKRVALSYEQHIGIPTSLWGETEYFVNQVKVIDAP